MHNKFFRYHAIEAKHRGGLLGAYFDCFLARMQKHGYSKRTMRSYTQCVIQFGKYLHRRGIRSIDQLEGVVGQKLLVAYQHYRKDRGYWNGNSALRFYIRTLEEDGVLKSSAPRNSSLFHESKEYLNFLKDQRGFSEGTIQGHIYWVEKFLEFLKCQRDTSCLPSFGIADVDRFIEREAIRLQRTTKRLPIGHLRSFLRFLHQSEKITTDLSCLITPARCYKLESLPHVLNWGEVQKILDSVDLSMKTGLRDYAILVLLSTYGLRAGEVAQLKLEDIDWRKETIHITPRKMGKDLWLPLTPQVGKAILEYLKRGRPPSRYRKIFFLTRAPWTPVNKQNISYVVNRHIQLAGLNPPRHGAHLLRHSFATRLIRGGASLKEIGDMLGHQSPESTHIYTKTATEQLREVALEIPEVR